MRRMCTSIGISTSGARPLRKQVHYYGFDPRCVTEVTQGGHMVTAVEIADFLRREFPQTKCVVEAVGDGTSTVSHEITARELRPGGTVSGPILMSVADVALYVAILAKL